MNIVDLEHILKANKKEVRRLLAYKDRLWKDAEKHGKLDKLRLVASRLGEATMFCADVTYTFIGSIVDSHGNTVPIKLVYHTQSDLFATVDGATVADSVEGVYVPQLADKILAKYYSSAREKELLEKIRQIEITAYNLRRQLRGAPVDTPEVHDGQA